MGVKVTRQCPVCGKGYEADEVRLRHGRQTSCSRACSYELRAAGLRTGDAVPCAVCGESVYRNPTNDRAKHGARFCSRRCHYIGRTLGLSKRVVVEPYRLTRAGRTSMSKGAARRYAAGETIPFPSTEMEIVDRLARAGVAFIHQHVIETHDRGFVVDLYFPAEGIAVEIDSADHCRKSQRLKDQARAELLESMGIKLARFRQDKMTVPEMSRAILAVVVDGRGL